MLLSGGSAGVGRVLPVAHPVAGHPHLDVPVAPVAAAAFLVVLVVGLLVPRRAPRPARAEPVTAAWEGELGPVLWVVRGLSVGLLLLAIVAGRVGVDDQLRNVAPALLIGAGWPLVFLGGLLLPGFWRWVDPWDSLGRAITPGDRSGPGDDVRPALVPAFGILWYLGVFSSPLDPRALGTAAAAYTVITVAGCIARGRQRWLSTAEPVGIVLTRMAEAHPGRGPRDQEQVGLLVLLGGLAGGTLFAAFRRTEEWTELVGPERMQLTGTIGLLAACAAGAGLAHLQAWGFRVMGAPAATSLVVVAMAPAVAGVVVAVAMARNRLTTSLQLLPGLAGDPFGEGWDLLGDPVAGLDPAPLGAWGLLAAQLSVLVLATAWGAASMALRSDRQVRLPAVLLLGQLAAVGAAAVSLH